MSGGRFRWLAGFAVLLAAVLGGLAVYGFIAVHGEAAREPRPQASSSSTRPASTGNGNSVITLDAAAQRADGVKVILLKNAAHQPRLRAYGNVVDLAPLTELASRQAEAAAQLAIAQAKLVASRAAFERARALFRDRQNMSAADLQTAEAAFHVDQAGLMAAQARLDTLAISARQNWGPVLGEAVVNETPLLHRLMARDEVLVQVTLRPGEAVTEPPANAVVGLDNGTSAPLHFLSAATKTDPRLQGLSLLFTAPADSGLLPGISVVAFLAGGPAVEGVVVPPSAIVWDQGRAWAYFRNGSSSFARRRIATDRRLPEGGYLVQGIPDNAELVVAGAQMLLSEESRGVRRAAPEDDD
ncbi:MAG TPA: multidrug transporter [Stellaceae bacterium]|nr:multidrug transporter [Stellaceae bacterium]